MCVWVYVYVCVYMCVCVCVRACVCVCMCVCCDEGWITVAKPPAIVLFLCLPKFHSCNFCSCPVMKWRRGGGGGGRRRSTIYAVHCSYKAVCNEHCYVKVYS